MPSALVSTLSAPLRELRAMVGTGTVDDTGAALRAARETLADLARAAAWTGTPWTGAAADAAHRSTHAIIDAIDDLAGRLERLGSAATAASAAVARARARLDTIIEEFEARAAALAADPDAGDELAEAARAAHDEARGVVDDLTGDLDTRTAAMPGAGWTGFGGSAGGGFGSGAGLTAPVAAMGAAGHRALARTPGSRPRRTTPTADAFGSDLGVQLPGGATASAPNAVAASAVRHALTQLGVPYDWGGTTPGVGLDCSGLTQWAYGEAGLDLPRLAQEQDVGAAVSRDALRPGDLAVWDGHVAMVVGDGLMVEAGDPVQLSPIRTTNAGQGFQGFWRPTA